MPPRSRTSAMNSPSSSIHWICELLEHAKGTNESTTKNIRTWYRTSTGCLRETPERALYRCYSRNQKPWDLPVTYRNQQLPGKLDGLWHSNNYTITFTTRFFLFGGWVGEYCCFHFCLFGLFGLLVLVFLLNLILISGEGCNHRGQMWEYMKISVLRMHDVQPTKNL